MAMDFYREGYEGHEVLFFGVFSGAGCYALLMPINPINTAGEVIRNIDSAVRPFGNINWPAYDIALLLNACDKVTFLDRTIGFEMQGYNFIAGFLGAVPGTVQSH